MRLRPKTASKSGPKITTIDEYLKVLPADQQSALATLRSIIQKAAPQAEECISYGIPAFRQNGMLVSFGAASKHCAFYVMSPATMAAFAADLQKYDTSKGTIRFLPDKPLPVALVRKLVKARLAENVSPKAAK